MRTVVRTGFIGIVVVFVLAVATIAGFAQAPQVIRNQQETLPAIQYQIELQKVTSDPQSAATEIVRRWENTAMERGRWDERFAEDLYNALLKMQPDNLLAAYKAATFDDLLSVLATGRPVPTLKPDEIDARIDPAALGDVSSDLVFTPVAPCRIVDTRNAGGLIAANTFRAFDVDDTNFADQGGYAGSCGIPFGVPRAVVMSIAVTGTQGFGWLTAWQYGDPQPFTSMLNYLAGWTTASTVVVPVLPGGGNDFYVAIGNAGAHVIVDVAGYYAAPIATPLDCIEVDAVGAIPAGGQAYVNAMCPAGRTATGGGGTPYGTVPPADFQLSSTPYYNGWTSWGYNPSGSPVNINTKVVCCRVPGR